MVTCIDLHKKRRYERKRGTFGDEKVLSRSEVIGTSRVSLITIQDAQIWNCQKLNNADNKAFYLDKIDNNIAGDFCTVIVKSNGRSIWAIFWKF